MKKIFFISLITIAHVVQAQWTQILYNQYASYDCIMFVNQNTGWHTGGLSVSRSTDGGQNWQFQASFETGVYPRWLYFTDESYGWVVCQDGNYLRTTNGGINWILGNYPDSTHFRSVYFVNHLTGWAAGSYRALGEGFTDNKVVKTINGGINWFPQVFDYYEDYYSVYFVNQNTGWVAGTHGRVLKTTDAGNNWVLMATGTSNELFTVFFISNNIGWIGGINGTLSKTTNGGLNWFSQNSGFDFRSIFSIYFVDILNGWIVGGWGYIKATTNGGLNWTLQRSGSYEDVLRSVCFINDTVGWASGDEKIFKTTNAGVPLGLNLTSVAIPSNYSLSQNYPNPFNPTTRISFSIPPSKGDRGMTNVKLIVYDILGREVATLVNEQLKPGSYEAEWDGSNFASGIYFYSLQTEQFTETKKMVLMK